MNGIIVDAIALFIVILFAWWGRKKGLTHFAFKLLNFIISIIIVLFIYKPVTNFIIDNTQFDEKISNKISEKLMETNIAEGEVIKQEDTKLSKSLVEIINKYIVESVNNAKENVVEYVSNKLTHIILSVTVIIILILIAKFGLGFIKKIAQFIANLPIIKLFDKSGGLVYGLIKGLLIVHVILAIMLLISPLILTSDVIKFIEESYVCSKIYNNNILLQIF